MRKASYRPTEAYLAYVRVGYKRLDKIRRSIAQFFYLLRIIFLISATTIFIRLSVVRASLILSLAWMMVV